MSTGMNPKYLLIVPGYPSDEDRYNNVFVHSRVQSYLQKGLDLDVFNVCKTSKISDFEGVRVHYGTLSDLKETLNTKHYDKILVHFALKNILDVIAQYAPTVELLIWIHGYEALSWKRRAEFFEAKTVHRLIGYIIVNTIQLASLRNFIQKRQAPIHLVFVSQWMRQIFIEDTRIDESSFSHSIIPNGIDTLAFKAVPKTPQQRFNILSIRPYSSRKYANDQSVAAVLKLAQTPLFDQLHFAFYGKGRLFKGLTDQIRHFKNVEIHEGFLTHAQIIQVHQHYGIMLIPTRQDSQGVSMGEAMSSGLVPIASNNTAIPEFLDQQCGYLTNSVDEIVQAIETLVQDPDRFIRMSNAAAQRVRNQCSSDLVLSQELDLITAGNNTQNSQRNNE